MVTLLRRVFWLAVVGGAGFAGWSAWRRRNALVPAGPPEWPPIEPPTVTEPAVSPAAESARPAWVPPASGDLQTRVHEQGDPKSADATPLAGEPLLAGEPASVGQLGASAPVPDVSAHTETATDSSPSGALTWVASDGGSCHGSHPIKANSNSGIYHVPGGRFYNQTRAERCYALAEDAEADGYRRAKS